MANWIIDEQWLDESSWFSPPPPQVVPSENNSPIHSFGDYVYPTIGRLVRLIILIYFIIFFLSDSDLYGYESS